jgi:hypothetical protein
VRDVVIRGDGIAAYCCAHLLAKAGFRVALKPVERPRLPVIMLGDHALALIRDIFDRPDLFRGLPRIERRAVAWADSKPATLEHSAVVVSENLLLNSLRPLEVLDDEAPQADADWTVFSSRPLPASVIEHRFGSRMAAAVPIELRAGSDSSACWIESLENGWLFLIPNAPGSGWLLAVGAALETLIGSSRVIAREISEFGPAADEFPAFPRIASPLVGPGWLACGTAAMAFDPICGDGTAHAIREAILASAVIRALAKDADADSLSAHYEARLTAGFRRHLQLCREFYISGATGPWWNAELKEIDRGIAWCDTKLQAHASFRYQLRGFDLEPIR